MLVTPHLPPHGCPPTPSTCVEGPSKDPALAVSDGSEARFFPLLEDLHTAIPVPWVQTPRVVATPIPGDHAIVIIAVDLGRGSPRCVSGEFRGQGREMRKEARKMSSGFSVSSWVIWG